MCQSADGTSMAEEALTGSIHGLRPLIVALGDPLGTRLLATLAMNAGEPAQDASLDELAIIDRELARLFAARELYLAWVEELREQERPALSPAQFLRAWSESTGRVIQLLRARRDLGGAVGADALLDAVYQELERLLPESDGATSAWSSRAEGRPGATSNADGEERQ